MSDETERWTVRSNCINCMASRSLAPQVMGERDGQSVFERQPDSDEEVLAAWRALQVCPVGAVRAPRGLRAPGPLFPQDLGGGIHRVGHNTRASYGAHSYFVSGPSLNLLVDGPEWSDELVRWIDAHGGLHHVLLTHRDDIGSTKRYAEHFGAEVWIHEADADAAPFATVIIAEGDTAGPAPEVTIVAVPGHTRGSVAYLVAGDTLFSGDTLDWDERQGALRAHREFCWFDWTTQLDSIADLQGLGFSQLLAGHGGSVRLSPQEMDAQIAALVARARA